jgi:hypothetical protein
LVAVPGPASGTEVTLAGTVTIDAHPGLDPGRGSADQGERPSDSIGQPGHVGCQVGRSWGPPVVCGVVYLAASLLVFGHFDDLGSAHLAGPGGSDQFIQVWWIAWAEHALAHGGNPFFSNWINSPVGINAGPNGSMLALGTLFSPITAIFGPVVTWNVLVRLALFVSAFAMCIVLRRWTSWWPAAFMGGLLYGFCVCQTGEANGYLFLTFVPLPPVAFLLLYEGLVRQRWKPSRAGAMLAAVCAAQFLVSSEIFVSTLLFGLVAVACYLVAERKSFSSHWPYARTFATWAVLAGAVLLVVPVGFALFGPQAANGAPNAEVKLFHGDLLAAILSTHFQRFTTPGLSLFAWQHLESSAELYVGFPFVVAVAGTVVWLRARGIVVLAGAMAALSYLLSLGSTLYVGGHDTHVPLPYIVLAHLPLLQGLDPLRFSLFTSLFGAAVVAFGLDEAYRRWCDTRGFASHALRRRPRVTRLVVMVALAVIVVLPMLPLDAERVVRTDLSPVFSSAAIPSGSVVLTYPYANYPLFPGALGYSFLPRYQDINYALLDQAAAGIPFRLIGSYGWRPDGSTGNTAGPSSLTPASVQAFFDFEFYGVTTQPGQAHLLVSSHLVTDLRQFLHQHDVRTVIVLPVGRRPATVTAFLTSGIGAPSHFGGAAVWFDVQHRLETVAPRGSRSFVAAPPLTRVVRPLRGARLEGRQNLAATASSDLGISKVLFQITGMGRTIVLKTVPLYGWLGLWDTTKEANGTYTVRSVAYGASGQVTTSPGVVVHVANG